MTKNTKASPVRPAITRKVALPLLAASVLALGACNILDVDNPNNLVEESIRTETAANAVVNGAAALVARSVSSIWQPFLIASDELTWIGSRDAWLQLDQGFVSDFNNEFTDAAFPELGRARWMADEAVRILEGHVQKNPNSNAFKKDLARANFFSGVIYTVIGEVQEDFAFSNKTEAAPPVGAANMSKVLDDAIARLDKAVTAFNQLGEADLELRAIAARARAKHSRAVWSKIKPAISTSPLIASQGATADAGAVISRVGVTSDWNWKFTYDAATVSNDMAGWINARAENQFDTVSVINVDQKIVKKIQSVRLRDPITNQADPVITRKLNEWKGGSFTNDGDGFSPLTYVSARMMHLILAEDALQKGDNAGLTLHVNHVRAMDNLPAYTGQIPARDILLHERRVNLFLMGLRLNDMYRFGVRDPLWAPTSDTRTKPGTLLPITIIERRANPFLKGSG